MNYKFVIEAQDLASEALRKIEEGMERVAAEQETVTETATQASEAHTEMLEMLDRIAIASEKLASKIEDVNEETKENTEKTEENTEKTEDNTEKTQKNSEAQEGQFVKLKKVAVAAAAVLAAYLGMNAAMAGMQGVVKMGADLEHLSTRTGVSVSELAILRQAFTDNGASAEATGQIIGIMQKQLFDASRGVGEGKVALDALGVTLEEIQSLSPAEQFALLSRRISAIEDPATRSAVAMKMFGESGTQLLPFFANGGALDDAARSLGSLPDLLDASAAEFERIDTLMGRLPNKARQLWGGVAQQLSGIVLEPLERLDAFDFTAIGQRIGAYLGVLYESFQAGELPEIIGLSISAGAELGMDYLRAQWVDLMGWIANGDAGLSVADAFLSAAPNITDGLLSALRLPMDFLQASGIFIADKYMFAFSKAFEVAGNFFIEIINGALGLVESGVNKMVAFANKFGAGFHEVSIGKLDPILSANRELIGYQEAYAAVSAENAENQQLLVDFIREAVTETRNALGAEIDLAETRLSSIDRLNAKMDEFQSRTSSRLAGAGKTGGTFSSGGQTVVGPDTVGTTTGNVAEQMEVQTAGALDTFGQFQSQMIDIANDTSALVAAPFQGMFQGLTESIDGLIMGTMTWQDALLNVGSAIAGAVVAAFAQLAAAVITNFLITALGLQAIAGTAAATMAGTSMAAGAAVMGAWVPAAIAASIATFGGAAAAGSAAFTMAMIGGALTAGLAAGLAGVLMGIMQPVGRGAGAGIAGARRMGGPVSAGETYLVGEDGPELLRMGSMSGYVQPNASYNAMMANAARSGSYTQGTEGNATGRGRSRERAVFHAVGSMSDAQRFKRSYPGEVEIRQMARDEIRRARR